MLVFQLGLGGVWLFCELFAKARMELASLLMASTRPLMPCLVISALDSSICSLLSCKLMRSLCLFSSLSSQACIASAIIDALLEIAEPISTSFEMLLVLPPPTPPPLVPSPPFLLLFAAESECSLVSESELSHTSQKHEKKKYGNEN